MTIEALDDNTYFVNENTKGLEAGDRILELDCSLERSRWIDARQVTKTSRYPALIDNDVILVHNISYESGNAILTIIGDKLGDNYDHPTNTLKLKIGSILDEIGCMQGKKYVPGGSN